MQQVNLYVPELRPTKEWMTAKTLTSLTVGLFILMSISVGINYIKLGEYREQIVQLENQRLIIEKRLDDIKRRSPKDISGQLDVEIESLKLRVEDRILVSGVIGSKNLGNRQGYSPRFDDLASTTPSTLAIERFRFSQGASFVNIKGQSRKAGDIAEFISALKMQEGFESALFGALTISETQQRRGVYQFSFGFDPLFEHESAMTEPVE